ncbi:MAG: O-antigen ligase family protein, partial [bacterium]|nr:O-antigen ligase family protein [bacterium]
RAGRIPGFHKTRFNLPVLVYLTLSVLAFAQALNPVAALIDLSHQLTFALLFLILVATFPAASISSLLRAAAVVGIAVSVLGILESRGVPMGWLPSSGRPSATFGYRNFAASFLVMNIPLALALWLRGQNLRDTCLGACATGLMVVFLVYTRSRGAWAGLAGAAILTALLIGHARWHWKTPFAVAGSALCARAGLIVSVCVILFCAGLALLPPQVISYQSRTIDEEKMKLADALASVTTPGADRGRLALWRHTLAMIADHPLGVGPGNWRFQYPPYDGGDMLKPGSEPARPHNDLLWIAAELGLPGLAAFFWLLLVAAASVVRVLRTPGRPERALYATAFGASLLAMLGHGLFSFPRERAETSLLFWVALGILALLDTPRPRLRRTNRPVQRPQLALYLLPVLLLATVWFTSRHVLFDRHYLRSHQYYRGGDLSATLHEASTALQYGPFDPQVYLLLGKGHRAAGFLQQARTDNLEGLRHHPHSLQLMGDLGAGYAQQDSLEQAEDMFKRMLEISPGYYEVYNDLGGVYQKRGDVQAAIEAYRLSLKNPDPRNVITYNNLGLAHMAVGHADSAIAAYKKALKLAPNEPWILHNLADTYYEIAAQDTTAFPLALQAYRRFLNSWTGPLQQAETARARIAEIQRRLTGEAQ